MAARGPRLLARDDPRTAATYGTRRVGVKQCCDRSSPMAARSNAAPSLPEAADTAVVRHSVPRETSSADGVGPERRQPIDLERAVARDERALAREDRFDLLDLRARDRER